MADEELKPTKRATILDREDGGFGLDYDNSLGKKNTTRLEAGTYERALAEARYFLEIKEDNYDSDGYFWEIE
jgi:hypothetical protein